MNVNEFIQEYGEYVKNYKTYDDGTIRVKFKEWDTVMWLKGVICEKMGMKVKDSSNYGPVYWFEPNN